MGRLPKDVLSQLRSPPEALADLMAKFDSTGRNHPQRPLLERMIRQLETEISQRGMMGEVYP
jgi:hypothetical protein